MRPVFITLAVLLIAISGKISAKPDTVNEDVVISKVDQAVDLTTHLPKVISSVTYKNNGKTTVLSIHYAVNPLLADKVAFIEASTKSATEEGKLTVEEAKLNLAKGAKFYLITLGSPLAPGKEVELEVETVYPHSLEPYPKDITQAEKQFVRFHGNPYFYAPYTSTTQQTVFTLATNNVEAYSKTPKPVAQAENVITYGPYENVAPYTEADVVLHYENNRPFLVVTELIRTIEISHWGNIAVEESIDIRHSGASLKGPFSRFDYQRNQDGVSSVKSFKTLLPPSARDVYYRDEIGNISTSNLKEREDFVEVELRPRFPLFGGWKTHYILGYNVPSYQYLYSSGDQFVLKMRMLDHIYDDQVIEEMTLKVILPEGSTEVNMDSPFVIAEKGLSLHFTYLDTQGRPVYTATCRNMVDNHMQDFELHYKFNRMRMLLEPMLVVVPLYLLFLVVIFYVRLDFSITKDDVSESRLRVGGLIEQVQTLQDRRTALYQSYEDAINKFKTSKDSVNFLANRKKVDSEYKSLTEQLKNLQNKLKAESSDNADKVAELQKLDQSVKEQISLAIQQAEKLIAGKINRQNYLDTDSAISSKKEELSNKIEVLLANV